MSKRNRIKKNKDEQLRERQKASMKSMYFNRFLMVRYLLAVFFFANFSWTVLAWGSLAGYLALALVLLALIPMFEMGRMYGHKDPKYNWTRFYFRLQWVLTAAMSVLIWTAPVSYLYPFFTETLESRLIGFGISLIGLVMATLVVRRIAKIDNGTDKQYQRIQYFETKYRLHI